MLNGLRTVVFKVDDLGAAKMWYQELLGVAPYFDQPFYVGFDVAGYELGLAPRDDESPSGRGGAVAYWAVADVKAALDRATAVGGKCVEGPQEVGGGIVVATIEDPFGNALGLILNPNFKAR